MTTPLIEKGEACLARCFSMRERGKPQPDRATIGTGSRTSNGWKFICSVDADIMHL